MFSIEYCEILRHYVQTAASGSKTRFVQSLQTSRASESPTLSNTAQTSLLLCKFLEELHFWVTTFEINQIIFTMIYLYQIIFIFTMSYLYSIKSYVLKVILFVKQNTLILHYLKLTSCVTKTSPMWKNHLIFFFCIFKIDFFKFSRCSTKGAAHTPIFFENTQFQKIIVEINKTWSKHKHFEGVIMIFLVGMNEAPILVTTKHLFHLTQKFFPLHYGFLMDIEGFISPFEITRRKYLSLFKNICFEKIGKKMN